jgi:hypothetical protein
MAFTDKTLTCSDCGATFTFSAEDQEFFRSKGYTTSPSAVRNVARQERQSARAAAAAAAAAATEPRVRCSPQPALSAAKPPKFPSNPAVTSRFIAAIATEKPAPADK